MRITPETLEIGSTQKRNKNEALETFLKRITHVSLVGKAIVSMENLNFCKNLSVLYLYDNKITYITGLECCRNLTRLYLQNNAIEEITGLDVGLDRLNVLHLHNNRIRRITGLHLLPSLEHLKLDNQRLDPGEQLEFDRECLLALATSLRYLTLTSNHLKDVSPLEVLKGLESLDLAVNGVQDVEPLESLLSACSYLSNVNVLGNPVANAGPPVKLRQRLILASPSLTCLNEKDIPQVERMFVENMRHAQRSRRSSKDHNHTRDQTTSLGVSGTAGVAAPACQEEKPFPHLPPFASQYRDLMLSQLAKNTAAERRLSDSNLHVSPRKVASAAEAPH
ncbi:hypothetical protein SpCBS45565_g00455 [Spizellomyces sp. 'palustris']|nr:hypothetical protein SpCBS45565_g00455 [Spizellomyces sp. 'palustris']